MSATAEALADVREYQRHGVYLFKSADDFLTAMLGPRQHDAHVKTRRCHQRLAGQLAQAERGLEGVEAHMAAEREQIAQDLAATHGYDTAALRRGLHRWDAGCFSGRPFAKTRARQLGRALDIAIERAGAPALAAE